MWKIEFLDRQQIYIFLYAKNILKVFDISPIFREENIDTQTAHKFRSKKIIISASVEDIISIKFFNNFI